jgi:uncharacterized membrane protein
VTANIPANKIVVNRALVEMLAARKIISPQARIEALALVAPTTHWWQWISRLLLALGVALMLSGIVYFFAYNWVLIPGLAKLAGIQLLMLMLLAYYFAGRGLPARQYALLGSMILLGVFLAVFGQHYQTGADAYNLFMMWALLALPWVLLGNFAPLWISWLLVVNVFIALLWQQEGLERYAPWSHSSLLLYAAVNAGLLALREWKLRQGARWVRAPWVRILLMLGVIVPLGIHTMYDVYASPVTWNDIATGALSAGLLLALWWYARMRLRDLWSSAIVMFVIIAAAVNIVLRLNDALLGDMVLQYLVAALIVLGAMVVYIRWYQAASLALEGQHDTE